MARCVLLFKPYGVLSQFTPEAGHRTLSDFVPIPGIYAAGRLDRDSEGLRLLTDDGPLQHRLTDPRFEHPRTYWAQVEREPSPESLRRLEEGVSIEGYRTRPARARLLAEPPPLPDRDPPIRYRKSVPTAWIELTLTEGRNRQVRRMTAAIGHPTLRLVRCAIGDLRIGGLAPGEWRELTPTELAGISGRPRRRTGSTPRKR